MLCIPNSDLSMGSHFGRPAKSSNHPGKIPAEGWCGLAQDEGEKALMFMYCRRKGSKMGKFDQFKVNFEGSGRKLKTASNFLIDQ